MNRGNLNSLCGRKSKHSGQPCKNRAMDGQSVCYIHGGKSPQALRKAEERMRDLVHPAISSLARQIAKDEFAPTKYVLDWAGFRVIDQQPSADNTVNVTIAFDRADAVPTTLSLPDAD
jgi:hypothetical protein